MVVRLSLIPLFLILCSFPQKEAKLIIGRETLIVEIADSPKKWRRGLKYRDKLPENKGMLFIFPEEGYHAFWMKDTKIPLDIAFIDRNFYIIKIDSMEPFDTLHLHFALQPVKYVLEVNRGWFGRHQVQEGTKIILIYPK